jgi:hypothetical protein
MKLKRNLVTGLIGLALIAAPITAAARDNDSGRNNPHQAQAQSHNNAPAPHSNSAPQRGNDHARNFAQAPAPRVESHDQRPARVETRNFAPVPVTRNESRDQRSFRNDARNFAPAPVTRNESRDQRGVRAENRAPEVVEHRDFRQDQHDGDRWNRDRDRDYRNYGHRDDDDDYAEGAPYYVMPYGYAGGACAWARHLRNVYYYDRSTGHPAAAAYLLPQLRRAERNCGGVPYGYNDYGYSW